MKGRLRKQTKSPRGYILVAGSAVTRRLVRSLRLGARTIPSSVPGSPPLKGAAEAPAGLCTPRCMDAPERGGTLRRSAGSRPQLGLAPCRRPERVVSHQWRRRGDASFKGRLSKTCAILSVRHSTVYRNGGAVGTDGESMPRMALAWLEAQHKKPIKSDQK